MMPGGPNFNRDPGDEQLRELFSTLRQEEAAHTPPFAVERETPRQKHSMPFGWRLAGVSVFAATLLAALLWLRHGPLPRPATPGRSSAPVASITEWRPPTDFLLDTPGREILRTAPVIGLRPYLTSAGSTPNRKPKTPSAPRSPTPLLQ